MASTFTTNTRTYMKKKEKLKLIDSIWTGALVVNGCLIVASADLTSVTIMICAMFANLAGYIIYKG